jgi:PPM family protein phosphatase
MSFHIVAVAQTDPGKVRERNEDSALVQTPAALDDDTALLIVADGMGGYRAGDRASQLAVETIQAELEPLFAPSTAQPTVRLNPKAEIDGERSTVVLPEAAASEHYGGFITRAIRRANEVIITYGQEHREARGLGSTVTMVVTARGRAYVANVGDSRTYLFRRGNLRAITRDHSLVARLIEAGQIEPDAIYAHPRRNLIYRSLGADRDDLEVDLFEEELEPSDILLLCSDGLWEKVHTPQIIEILQQEQDLAVAGKRLIDLANANGGEDNITVILARCEGTKDPVLAEATEAVPSDIAEADTGEIKASPTAP